MTVIEVSVLRGRDHCPGQHPGDFLSAFAWAVPELQNTHLAPLSSYRGPHRATFRVDGLRVHFFPHACIGARLDRRARGARGYRPRAPAAPERDRRSRCGLRARVVGGRRTLPVVGISGFGSRCCGGPLRACFGISGWDRDGRREDGGYARGVPRAVCGARRFSRGTRGRSRRRGFDGRGENPTPKPVAVRSISGARGRVHVVLGAGGLGFVLAADKAGVTV